MGTYLKRTNYSPLEVGTTVLLNVSTGSATIFYMATGYMAIHFTNVGPSTIAWGGSSITASSAGNLSSGDAQSLENLADNFSFYFIATSVQSTVAINQFRA